MAVDEGLLEFITEQLLDFGEISVRKMFGGAGIYYQNLIIGLVADDGFYLKADEQNCKFYTDRKLERFNKSEKNKGMPYYKIPEEILDRLGKAPDKTKEGIAIAADTIKRLQEICRGALLVAIGGEERLAAVLE